MKDSAPTETSEAPSDSMALFSDFLVRERALDAVSIERARRAADTTDERFERVLPKLGLVAETDLARLMADFLGLDRFNAEALPQDPLQPDILSPQLVKTSRNLPLALNETSVMLLTDSPFQREASDAIGYALERSVDVVVSTPTEWDRAFDEIYGNDGVSVHSTGSESAGQGDDLDVHRLRDIASEGPIIKLVGQIIVMAVEARASDIHIEPAVDQVHVRYRVDGLLRSARNMPANLKAAVISRIKIMARLDIAERRLPQDGRMKVAVRGVDIDFRVSTIPTAFGESVVLRILDRSRVTLDFRTLGFASDAISSIRKLVQLPNGIVLVTGPTGSGKTTTLYTAIKELDASTLKIFTVEDPIEYQLPGINQVQVQPQIGFDFPAALRSILRQDPDVIMIGEIRDLETAKIAVQASLTGHLVLSTVHTNSAVATIGRLIDMGVEDYLLASTLQGVLAQRLVRRLCSCAGEHPDAVSWRKRLNVPKDAMLLQARGCSACGQTGYLGRMTISEMLVIQDDMRRLLVGQTAAMELARAAKNSGMKSLYASGLDAVFTGLTSIEEVLSVVQED
jgi:general secretion pathway protein E